MQKYKQFETFRNLLEDLNMTTFIYYKDCPNFLNRHKQEDGGVVLNISNKATGSCLFYLDNEYGEMLELDFKYQGIKKLLYIPIDEIKYIYANDNPNINIGITFQSYEEVLEVLNQDKEFVEYMKSLNNTRNYTDYGYVGVMKPKTDNKPVKIKPNYLKLVVSNKQEDIKPCDREIIRNFHIV